MKILSSIYLAIALILNSANLVYAEPFHGLTYVQRTAPKSGIYLEFLSWDKVEEVLQNAKAVLLPLGSNMKEHGLHLPMNNDWLIAEYLTMRVLDQVAIAAMPTMSYGYYPAFVDYPGSVHLSKTTARDLIIDVCRSITKHGPKKVYVLNTGFSTNRPLEAARQVLAEEGIVMDYLDLQVVCKELEKEVSQQPFGSHADEIETSMMMYILPEIVNLERAQPETSHPGSGPFTRDPVATSGRYSATGAWGDPTLATMEKGRFVIEAVVNHLVDRIPIFQSHDFVVAPPREQYLD